MKPITVTLVLEVSDNDSVDDVIEGVEDVVSDYLDAWDITDIYAEEHE